MPTKSVKIPTVPPASQAPIGNAGQALVGWLFPLYLIVIFLGYAFLRAPGAMPAGQEMGAVRGFFSVINAATLTGFPQTTDIDKYRPLGQATVFALIVCGSLLSLTIGGMAISRILKLGYSDRQIILAAFVTENAAIALGTFLLLFDRHRTITQAAFLAASAFGNAGLFLGPAPSPTNWQTHIILLPLITLGGLGLCVLMEISACFHGKSARLSDHARATLSATAWTYIIGTLALIAFGLFADPTLHAGALRDLVASSAAATVASRTAGLGLVAFTQISRPALWIIMLLMCLGSSSGGTAGGIKTTTFIQLFRAIRRALNPQWQLSPLPVIRERARVRGISPTSETEESPPQLSPRLSAIAAIWTAGYFLLILISFLALLQHLPQMSADRVLFTVISAASNVGLTDQPLTPDPFTAFILCAVMLSGRLIPLIVLWWIADTCAPTDLATDLAVG